MTTFQKNEQFSSVKSTPEGVEENGNYC